MTWTEDDMREHRDELFSVSIEELRSEMIATSVRASEAAKELDRALRAQDLVWKVIYWRMAGITEPTE